MQFALSSKYKMVYALLVICNIASYIVLRAQRLHAIFISVLNEIANMFEFEKNLLLLS